ncbi:Alcohol dehydrogenase, class IV [Marinitoga hydrogenitolerans DSM 16785]|uniref:Alcohol dehydrogenase, class IV n=1 Tax=Marinitoga hydrogenitolerans (strain DSM 16785 / JCM 12826 / AT1271) TaxID=1122195 RepID=A0A1M4YAA9_MARH1|nr:iron-containing alcohol dehydrogenase [Marinitoga hydrogenitolerans]SHF02640.1 Alcohol dehydrogenase, class IV [Marinitoga hydrogenitolerans DSM 16785]
MLLNGAWENKVDIYNVFELRCKTTAYFGVGAINKFKDICDFLNKKDIKKVIIITDDVVYNVTGIKEKVEKFLDEADISYIVYNGVKPNPNVKMIDEAKKIGLEFGAGAVIGVGGGSHIDTAKSVAVLLHEKYKNYTGADLYELKFVPEEALPIIAVNTTHGTGTEVDRFAVATIEEKGYKPALAYDSIYPVFAIDDPEITKSLPWTQTTYTAIDAINHVTEAATTLAASPYSILLAKETIRLVSKYLPQAQAKPGDLTARYFLLYASAIAGISFDNGLLHFTHALEHPLSGIKPDLPHGLGLAMLLPAVVKAIYPAQPEVLAEIYSPIVPDLKGVPGEAEYAAKGIEKWLFNIGVTQKLTDEGFKESDIDKLVELAFNTPSLDLLLSLAPIKATKDIVKQIYIDSLYPLNK